MTYLRPPKPRRARGIARPLWLGVVVLALLASPFAVNLLGLGIADVSPLWFAVGAVALAVVGGLVNVALDRLGD